MIDRIFLLTRLVAPTTGQAPSPRRRPVKGRPPRWVLLAATRVCTVLARCVDDPSSRHFRLSSHPSVCRGRLSRVAKTLADAARRLGEGGREQPRGQAAGPTRPWVPCGRTTETDRSYAHRSRSTDRGKAVQSAEPLCFRAQSAWPYHASVRVQVWWQQPLDGCLGSARKRPKPMRSALNPLRTRFILPIRPAHLNNTMCGVARSRRPPYRRVPVGQWTSGQPVCCFPTWSHGARWVSGFCTAKPPLACCCTVTRAAVPAGHG